MCDTLSISKCLWKSSNPNRSADFSKVKTSHLSRHSRTEGDVGLVKHLVEPGTRRVNRLSLAAERPHSCQQLGKLAVPLGNSGCLMRTNCQPASRSPVDGNGNPLGEGWAGRRLLARTPAPARAACSLRPASAADAPGAPLPAERPPRNRGFLPPHRSLPLSLISVPD